MPSPPVSREQNQGGYRGEAALTTDPTALTTQAMQRDLNSLRELMQAKLDLVEQGAELKHSTILTLLEEMGKATMLVRAESERLWSMVDEKIRALREVMEEKFGGIGTQFKERDVRVEQMSTATSVAVAAALQAAKEAVAEQNRSAALAIAKSETSTAKQIEQMGTTIQTGNAGMNEKVDDVKDRLTRIEGSNLGSANSANSQQSNSAYILALVIGITSTLLGVAAIIISIVKH
jgi:hypothetical protein